MLKIKELNKSYGSNEVRAVDSISLDIGPGEVFGFIGPNGAGKTTTIKMVVGILKPDSGTILIDGIDLLKNPIEAKKKFSYIPDNPEVYNKLRAVDYLNFIGDIYEIEQFIREERIKYYSKLFNIEESLGDTIDSFSHGMKQKLILTSGLITDPDLLILDEPMVGLDPKSAYNLKEEMKERCRRGKTVFFSTHVLEVAEKICTKVAIINKGKILYTGNIEELKSSLETEKSLEEIFLELTENE